MFINRCKIRTFCQDSTHARCISKKQLGMTVQKTTQWTCHRCLLSTLPFFSARTLTNEEDADLNIENEGEDDNRNRISIHHLNTQSITSSFAEFQRMLATYKFDIITLSETWLKAARSCFNRRVHPEIQKP